MLVAVLGWMCLIGSAQAMGTPVKVSGKPSESLQLEVLLGVVHETKLDPDRRKQAVNALLNTDNRRAIELLIAELNPTGDRTTQSLIAQAIATYPQEPPEALTPALLTLLEVAQKPLARDLAGALGRYSGRSLFKQITTIAQDQSAAVTYRLGSVLVLGYHRQHSAAKTLMKLINRTEPEPVHEAAFQALAQLTGVYRYGSDPDQWGSWWSKHRKLSVKRWQGALIENFATENRLLAQQTQHVLDRLVEAQRQLYRTTDQGDRQGYVLSLLGDSLEPLRVLGVDLLVQRLIDNQPIGSEVRASLLERLDDPSARVRQRSAQLLHNLADEEAAQAIAKRISQGTESSQAVLGAYLQMMIRLPQQQVVVRALELLADPELGGLAAGVIAASTDAGLLSPDQMSQAVVRVRQELRDDQPPDPRFIQVLGRFGTEEDWDRIASWIASQDQAVKQAAAKVWAESDRSLVSLAQLSGDLVIQPIVIDAARRRGIEAQTLKALIAHKPDQEQAVEAWERALVAMAGRVASRVVLETDRQLIDQGESLELREQMLSTAIEQLVPSGTHEANNGEGTTGNSHGLPAPLQDPQVLEAYIELLLIRAQVHQDHDDPIQALGDYKRVLTLQESLSVEQRSQADLGLLGATLATGEVDTGFDIAAKLIGNNSPGVARINLQQIGNLFLDFAEHRLNNDQPDEARRVIVQIKELLGETITGPLRERLTGLEQATTPAIEEEPITPQAAGEDQETDDAEPAGEGNATALEEIKHKPAQTDEQADRDKEESSP